MKQNLSMKTHLKAIKIVLCALVLGVCVAAQATLPPPNSGMGTITNGWFSMGDANDGNQNNDAPKHQVFVNAFQMDTNLITYANWQLVYQDATNHGYSFNTNAGSGVAANYPVQAVSWYDAVKWCNARSRMEGLTPCYYTATNFSMVYTSGIVSLKSNNVNWAANGYRLPTEAEWEKAARGGLTTNRFPWGMYITHTNACYATAWANGNVYDLTPNSYANNPTSAKPVGSFKPPNGYGLYDMAGNVNEWCWDFYTNTYYLSTPRPTNSPTGPVSGSTRVARGGNWNLFADSCRCAARFQYSP
jgi:formylglycine-generating enzyme required for sulfatase activity